MFASHPSEARHHGHLLEHQHPQSTAPSILSAGAAQSLLQGLSTPHASEFMYRPRPELARATTAPAVIPGLGFHVVPMRTQPPRPSSPGELFSPASVYSSNSPESNLQTSPSTDSLPSPVSSRSDDLHAEDDARAWSGTPEWNDDDDNYDSPVWGSRWARRNDSSVSDSVWGSADGGESLLSGSLGRGHKDGGSSQDAQPCLRRSSTGSSFGPPPHYFLPVPRAYSRRSESSVGSLFRFAGPAAMMSSYSGSPLEGDGWADLSNDISDEVHRGRPRYGSGLAPGSYRSTSRVSSFNTRGSFDSAFQFDDLSSSRRPSADSFLAPPPALLPRRAPILSGSLYPPPANAGAEHFYRRNSAGSFTDYQIRRASYERRTSVGSHPLVAAVDPFAQGPSGRAAPLINAGRRESTVSELERENRLAFLMDLQRRVSQVVEVQPGGRQYATDQWVIDRNAIQSVWSPSTVASDEASDGDDDIDDDRERDCSGEGDHPSVYGGDVISPVLSTDTTDDSPSSKYETLHKNISLTFSFEERLSPLSTALALPDADEDAQLNSRSLYQPEDRLADLSTLPLINSHTLDEASPSPIDQRQSASLSAAFAEDDDDNLEGESDVGHSSPAPEPSERQFNVEIATLRRVDLRTATPTQVPPVGSYIAFDDSGESSPANEASVFDMGYLADLVRILPTPQSSISAAGRRATVQQPTQPSMVDEFAAAFARSSSSPLDKPLPPAPTPKGLRMVQSMSSLTKESPIPSSPPPAARSKSDRLSAFLSSAKRPISELGSERSISPFTQARPQVGRPVSRGRRQAGSWDLPWAGQLKRSSVCSSAGVDAPAPIPTPRRRTSYVSQTVGPAPPAAAEGSDAGGRRPSTASLLPFQDYFVKQSVAQRRESEVKLHTGVASDSPPESPPVHDFPPAVPPKPKQRAPQPSPSSPMPTSKTCSCPLFFNRVDGKRVPVPHPAHAPPPAPPHERTRSDPVLGPSALARSTIHDPQGEVPVRFAVPRKQAPSRPALPATIQSDPAVPSHAAAGPLHSPPELKKRRSRAVLDRLFTKRDKGTVA